MEQRTHEMEPQLAERLKSAARLSTREVAPLQKGEVWEPPPHLAPELAPAMPPGASLDVIEEPATAGPTSIPTPVPTTGPTPIPTTLPGVLPPTRSGPLPIEPARGGPPDEVSERKLPTSVPPTAPRSRLPWILAGALGVVALGAGGWFAYGALAGGTSTAAAPTRDAGAARVAVTADAGAPRIAIDAAAAQVAVAADAASPQVAVADDAGGATPDVPSDAASTPPDETSPVGTPNDPLTITTKPAGARVFLDGSDAGVTPLELPGTPDRHTIALLLPGHELYVAEVDGHGAFAIPLKEVTPSGGPAGIKVIKCKAKDRYYVFVDGKPTGQTCPTERIETELGPHVVEVYDVVSETRKQFEINIKDTRLSHRVRIE